MLCDDNSDPGIIDGSLHTKVDTYYDILDIGRDANVPQIKKAYRGKVKEYTEREEAEEAHEELFDILQKLTNDTAREEYDSQLDTTEAQDNVYGDGDPEFHMGPMTIRDLYAMNSMLMQFVEGEYGEFLPGYGDPDTNIATGVTKNRIDTSIKDLRHPTVHIPLNIFGPQ